MTRLALDAVRALVTVAAGVIVGLILSGVVDRASRAQAADHPDALYLAALEAQALAREGRATRSTS